MNLPPATADCRFRFIDLFAGIGGMRYGFDAAGGKCVFTSERDKWAQETYRANFGDSDRHTMAGDITGVQVAAIPAHDLLLAGFPCQPFSLAGVSKRNSLGYEQGFECQKQGALFFNIADIIEYHRPAAFLLENVKHLLTHNKGETFRRITETLQGELGYHIDYRIFDAQSFLPQKRERIFIAGFRESTDFDLEAIPVPDPSDGPRLGAILHPEDGSEMPDRHYIELDGRVNEIYTISDKLWNYLKQYAEKHRRKGNGFGFGLVGPEDISRTLSARYHKDGAEILVRQEGRNPRRLTPRECSRLMGFDNLQGCEFRIPVSDQQAYRQFGNAVAVPVVNRIAERMAPCVIQAISPSSNAGEVAGA